MKRTGAAVSMTGRDLWWEGQRRFRRLPTQEMSAEDPLFILYTSGGKPKGIAHSTGGYAVWIITHQYVFDYRPGRSAGALPTSAGHRPRYLSMAR
jgi:acetyl-CoA synthetase